MPKNGKLLKDDWKPRKKGDKNAILFCNFLNTVARLFNSFEVVTGGYVDISSQYLRLYCFGSGSSFTGKAYNSQGVEFDVNKNAALPWVVYDSNTDTFSENAGPAPSPWPPHQIWYRKAGTAGDIVVKRIG